MCTCLRRKVKVTYILSYEEEDTCHMRRRIHVHVSTYEGEGNLYTLI
jgi:hypothetical protein